MTAGDVTVALVQAAADAQVAAQLSDRWADLDLQAQRVRVDDENSLFYQNGGDQNATDIAALNSACGSVPTS